MKLKTVEKDNKNEDVKKMSTRFFDDFRLRAVCEESAGKWYFSVLDIIGILNNEKSYEKCRNYWKYLKTRLKRNGSQLVSATTQLKITASDGKRYMSDVLDSDGVASADEIVSQQQKRTFP